MEGVAGVFVDAAGGAGDSDVGSDGGCAPAVGEGSGYRAPHAWACAEEEEGSGGSDDEGPVAGLFAADEGAVEAAAREAAAMGADARNMRAVDALVGRLEQEYAAVVGAGGGGGGGGAAATSSGDPGSIRSPVLAAALVSRPELRAKLEALKRARATWVTFEGDDGGGADEFPDDYGELQVADAQVLQQHAAAAAPAPQLAASPIAAAPLAVARPVSPLSEAKRAAIAAAMAKIKITPRGPLSPFLEKAVDASLKAGRASILAHAQQKGDA
jgi:hypothetical protein